MINLRACWFVLLKTASGSVSSSYGRPEFLCVEAARGRRRGEAVLLLVRPETVELEAAAADGGGLTGEVLSHTFLGSVTRLHVTIGPVEWSADLSNEQARALPVGARVRLRFPAASAQVLSLAESEALPSADPDGR